jgi:hypothetical protein
MQYKNPASFNLTNNHVASFYLQIAQMHQLYQSQVDISVLKSQVCIIAIIIAVNLKENV